MQQRRNRSIDGFVVRSGDAAGAPRLDMSRPAVPGQFLRRPDPNNRQQIRPDTLPTPTLESEPVEYDAPVLEKNEISKSLEAVDYDDERRQKKRRFGRPQVSKKKVALFIGVLLLLFVGFFGFKFLTTSGKLFSGSIFDLLGNGATLKADANGRTNILVFGTSEDDPAHADAGANLTDSIMIVSIDQKNKNAVMVSVPRDLWVKYGEACLSGYEGKINVVYECGSDDGSNEQGGAKKLMEVVGDNFGIDLQYYAHVNYSVVRDTVNAVGGVTVEIDSDDPRGILDRNFDWACNMQCYYVKWPNGPANLNGDQALALARARNAAGGYGLGGGNFDREQYQQKIIVAIKDKAASAGTLANPLKVTGIMDALGNNVRTSFSAGEVKTLIRLAGDIPSASIKRVSLVETGKAVLQTDQISGQSAVRPVKGIYDFSGVKSFISSKLSVSTSATSEAATIEVLNGSDSAGLAGKKAAELQAAGFSEVTTGDTETKAEYGNYVWYDLSGGKMSQTQQKLTSILGKNPSGTVLPTGVQSSADFVIIMGNGAN